MADSHEYRGITWSVVGQVYWEFLNELKLHILWGGHDTNKEINQIE